ncbi:MULTISPECIES: sporulation protein Cse60 [Acinetobacter]|jgi:hypothetical protein|uniref:sporulation protein Cse60 n=1 Tax=Acinetobacter TaxID=469 RepID=UPI000628FBDD|nr:hypothetical protein [Acinetobacter sp. AG1]KKW82217.1 hypothetical protein AAV96_01215 [Acinetobacter sp. AG1]
MAKIKAFESSSILDLEVNINEWLRTELKQYNHQVNIKFISHSYTNENVIPKFTALIVYDYN